MTSRWSLLQSENIFTRKNVRCLFRVAKFHFGTTAECYQLKRHQLGSRATSQIHWFHGNPRIDSPVQIVKRERKRGKKRGETGEEESSLSLTLTLRAALRCSPQSKLLEQAMTAPDTYWHQLTRRTFSYIIRFRRLKRYFPDQQKSRKNMLKYSSSLSFQWKPGMDKNTHFRSSPWYPGLPVHFFYVVRSRGFTTHNISNAAFVWSFSTFVNLLNRFH